MATLNQLIAKTTIAQALQKVLGVYQSYGFPTSAWMPGGTDATRSLAIATAVTDLSANYIPSIAAGGFTQLAAQLENPGWIQLLAEQIYDVLFGDATHTVGSITLAASPSANTTTIAPGQLIAVFADTGNRYINNTGGTLSPAGTLTLLWTAEEPGASYNDPSSATITLATPLAGVTLSNPAGLFTDVAHVGSGTGSVIPSGTPSTPHQVVIRIDSTGASGSASWSYSLDGAPYVSAGAVSSLSDLGGTNIDVSLIDGVSGTSFVLGDAYLFNTPGSWITSQGADTEAPFAIALRCQDRWSTVSKIATESFYEFLVRSVPTVGAQVTQTIVYPDSDVNNKVNIVVAGPAGVLPPGVVASIQDYVTPRAIGTDYPTVVSPTVHDTTISFAATASASLFAVTKSAVETAIGNYVNTAGINPTLRLASIIDLAMDQTGMIDVSDVLIDGVAANLVLGSSSSFVVAKLAALNITWVTQA